MREKRLKNVIAHACAVAVLCAGTALAADPTISVSIRQRYPWNGLVDINFTITGEAGTRYYTSFAADDVVGGTNIAMQTIRKADGSLAAAIEALLPGSYKWVWDAAADLPKGWKCDELTVSGTALDTFSYSVKFNANGGTGTMANESFTSGTAKALTANAFTRTGYTFQGWATSASGAKVYNDGQSVSNLTEAIGGVVNLYAVWKGISYSVKFNANGGSGTMSNESFTYGTAKALTANAFKRDGFTFQGWATSASGAKVYNNKQSVSNLTTTSSAVVNLYAVWTRNKVQLWSGGPYWAETNIGAEKVSDHGYYFWWGDTVGYKRQSNKWVASNGSSSNFSFSSSNTPTNGKTISALKSGGWINSNSVLVPAHDAARVHWGGNWRMPTVAEFNSLINNCTWTLTTTNSVKGYIVKGKGNYASSRIFIPFTGYGSGTSLTETTTLGDHWSSSVSGSQINDSYNYTAWSLFIDSSHHNTSNDRSYINGRQSGLSIRPVCSQ